MKIFLNLSADFFFICIIGKKINQNIQNYYLVMDENGKTVTRCLIDSKVVHDALALKNMIYIINYNELRQLKFFKC
jgi:hypothetical protein